MDQVRIGGVNQFTHINVEATLVLANGANDQKALRLLTKAENQSINNSYFAATANVPKLAPILAIK